MTIATSQRRSPPSEDILRQWKAGDHFERASSDLIRRAGAVIHDAPPPKWPFPTWKGQQLPPPPPPPAHVYEEAPF